MQNLHEFALYFSELDEVVSNKLNTYRLQDKDLVHRIVKVLRLTKSEGLTLFSSSYNVQATIEDIIPKKELVLSIKGINKNKELKPYITYGLPILKKYSFEEAIYSLVELGVQEIQPLVTSKTQHKWIEKNIQKEFERLNKIIIAACEQAKQFNIPKLNNISTLDDWLATSLDQKSLNKSESLIFFDPDGSSSFEVIKNLKELKSNKLTLLSGPEASLTEQEKEKLLNYNFKFCALTPTILRATEAVTVALGLIRSLLP